MVEKKKILFFFFFKSTRDFISGIDSAVVFPERFLKSGGSPQMDDLGRNML